MVGLGVVRFVVVARRWRVPNIGEWQCTFCGAAHCWNTRLSCCRCGTLGNWQSGGAGHGGLVGNQGQENGQRSGVGSAMGGVSWFGPTGRDQAHVSQGEPTFRKGGGAQGRGKSAGVPGAGVGTVRFEEGVVLGQLVREGWTNRCLLSCSLTEGPGLVL